MRHLMGVAGDDVEAMMKVLQLDTGFVHQYMGVVYKLIDERHGEFWLDHCGALLDAEPHGEEMVIGMCHTIEDPTFDATAFATNPQARIRPVHRPPRTPSDRHPHCHWTITIDPGNDPVAPAPLTRRVAELPLASVANQVLGSTADGMADYRGPLVADFRLGMLSSGTLAAVAREFQIQAHLLHCAGEMACIDRFGQDQGRSMSLQGAVAVGWVVSKRIAWALPGPADPAGIARVMQLHPALPPGFEVTARSEGSRVTLTLVPQIPGLLDPDHPGLPGMLARGQVEPVEAMFEALAPTATVRLDGGPGALSIEADLEGGDPARLPDAPALLEVGAAAYWNFNLATA
jgi:hypothetical protein